MFLLLVCLLSGLLIGVLGITYKLSSRNNLDADAFRNALTWIAATLALSAATFAGEPLPGGSVLFYSVLCGGCFFLALIAVIRAMEIGPVSFTWVLINLSIVLPIIVSAVLWSEPVRTAHWAGFGFFTLSLILFGRDLAGGEQKRLSLEWVFAATIMFLANGTFLVLFKVIDRHITEPHTFVTLGTIYITSALLFIIRKRKVIVPRPGEWKLGSAAAGSMLAGQALIMVALSINTASSLPVIHGVSIIVVAVASAVIFGERFSRYSAGGLLAGLASITLLTLG
jgi:drug/metabolite transporter (DMT)-like permease